MVKKPFYFDSGRKIVVTGHYGSGKTEFALSLAFLFSAANTGKLAIVDLDIVNPYFRSREHRDLLNAAGVGVFGSAFDKEVTTEIPALGANLRAPLEDKDCRVIVDVGGNDRGALVLNQIGGFFTGDDSTILAVVNANRPDTSHPDGAAEHIFAIESATGLVVSGIVNNCHLLRETDAATIIKGHELCMRVCEKTGKQLWCDCYPEGIVDPGDLSGLCGRLMPLGLYLRPAWLDK